MDRAALDFDKTFVGAALLRVEPKLQRKDKADQNSEQVHAHDKTGVPKWTVHLSVETKSFENTKFDNIQITITSPNKPGEGIPENSKVTVEGLALGMMPQGKFYSIFYTADAIRPVQSAQFAQPSRVASSQPVQPVRVTSTQ